MCPWALRDYILPGQSVLLPLYGWPVQYRAWLLRCCRFNWARCLTNRSFRRSRAVLNGFAHGPGPDTQALPRHFHGETRGGFFLLWVHLSDLTEVRPVVYSIKIRADEIPGIQHVVLPVVAVADKLHGLVLAAGPNFHRAPERLHDLHDIGLHIAAYRAGLVLPAQSADDALIVNTQYGQFSPLNKVAKPLK